jgi:tRNA(Ile)-lysidine synthase
VPIAGNQPDAVTAGPLAARFAAAMERLGPFGPRPLLAVAVSGGADSTALALCAHDWARARAGAAFAVIIDHGLRPAAAGEAALAAARMEANGIAAQIITLNIAPGASLQERARIARHQALAAATAAGGAVHLLLGHHAADQAEGQAMRAARGPGGAAGIAGFASRHAVVLVRPLLDIDPADLRNYLYQRGMDWIEDPSNADLRFERVRIRNQSPSPIATLAAHDLATCQRDAAQSFAAFTRIDPAGFAVVRADRVPAAALASLIRTIGGAIYQPARAAVDRLANTLQPATLGGVQIMRAGRFGSGWLLCREVVACAAPITARPGATWDSRFQIVAVPDNADTIGQLGAGAAQFRSRSGLPSAILRSLPAFFRNGTLVAVPHCQTAMRGTVRFVPPAPATSAPFGPLRGDVATGTAHHRVLV